MPSLTNAIQEYSEDVEAVNSFCNGLYEDNFACYFSEVRKLFSRMKDKSHPVTDEELEYILTELPLELFAAAETLNKFRLNYEVVKLKNKEKVEQFRKEATLAVSEMYATKTERQEYVIHTVNEKIVEYEILLSVYASIVTRVENEQSFVRELIMGAKKVWDSRRSGEQSNPVGPVVPNRYPMNTPSGYTPSGTPPNYIR